MFEPRPFCDKLRVSQTHFEDHEPFYGELVSRSNRETGETTITHSWAQVTGDFDSVAVLKSDGHKVELEFNPSRWNRKDNYYGVSLDDAKNIANSVVKSRGLPPFSGGVFEDRDSGATYTGATFSRIDMTQNFSTGSPDNRRHFLRHIQSQEYGKLERMTFTNLNTVYGHESDSRRVVVYDKALHVRDKMIKKASEEVKPYLEELADWLDKRGVFRIEVSYRRLLRSLNLRQWHLATQENLEARYMEDIHGMKKEIEVADLDDLPKALCATLLMYQAGLDLRKKLSENTFYKHKRELLKLGYDISNPNIVTFKPPIKVITLEPAGVPEGYELPDKQA